MKTIDEKLIKLYQEAEKEILAKIEQGNNKQILLDIQLIIQNLISNSIIWANNRILEEYINGISKIEKVKLELKDQDNTKYLFDFIGTNFGQIHQEAVKTLVEEATSYIGDINNGVIRGIKAMISDKQRKEILMKLAKKEITAEQLQDLKKEIVNTLKKDGITVLIDKAGRKWKLNRYAELIIKTETVKAQNSGTINRGLEVGIKEYKRIERDDCCSICQSHKGEIWNIDKQGVPPLLYHPGCFGSWEPIL